MGLVSVSAGVSGVGRFGVESAGAGAGASATGAADSEKGTYLGIPGSSDGWLRWNCRLPTAMTVTVMSDTAMMIVGFMAVLAWWDWLVFACWLAEETTPLSE